MTLIVTREEFNRLPPSKVVRATRIVTPDGKVLKDRNGEQA